MSTAVTAHLTASFLALRDALAAAQSEVAVTRGKVAYARTNGTAFDLADARDNYVLAQDTLCQVIPLYHHMLTQLDRMAIPVAVAEAAARDLLTIIHEESL
jgi:hypothetical protein